MTYRSLRIVTVVVSLQLAAFFGCGEDSNGGAGESESVDPVEDDRKDFALTPPQLYSAFVTGPEFLVPITAAVEIKEWKASDPTAVEFTLSDATSTLIRIRRAAPKLRIIAIAHNGQRSSAELTITAGSVAEYERGKQRYNDWLPLIRMRPTDDEFEALGFDEALAEAERMGIPREAVLWDKEASCVFCHGDTGTFAGGAPVRHTPQQVGGYTDQDLLDIIELGEKPPGAPEISKRLGSPQRWKWLHTWQVPRGMRKGLILYLRSLPPKPQEPFNDAPTEF